MVSELATNAVRHALTSFDLTVCRTPEEIRVEVTDYGDGVPMMRCLDTDAIDGRGLQIVDTLSTRWGVSRGPGSGKTVWFALALADRRDPASRGRIPSAQLT